MQKSRLWVDTVYREGKANTRISHINEDEMGIRNYAAVSLAKTPAGTNIAIQSPKKSCANLGSTCPQDEPVAARDRLNDASEP